MVVDLQCCLLDFRQTNRCAVQLVQDTVIDMLQHGPDAGFAVHLRPLQLLPCVGTGAPKTFCIFVYYERQCRARLRSS